MPWVIDQEICTGCNLCVETCPDVFQLNEETNTAVVIDVNASADQAEAIQAQEECPVECISYQ